MARKRESYVGITAMANCKMMMTIIKDEGVNNLTIQFEDGSIVYHKRWTHFVNGKIMNPSLRVQVGERVQNTSGLWMTICKVNSGTKDIDVMFDDGTIVQHRDYHNFKHGRVAYPENYQVRVGERNCNTYGEWMELIKYDLRNKVQVMFEDGTIRETTYDNFVKGNVPNPNSNYSKFCSLQEATFLFYLQNCGFKRYGKGYFKKFNEAFGQSEIDMFNEELMIGLEYDGCYWHRNKADKDIEKDMLCYQSGIDLIRIRESSRNNVLPKLNSGYSYEIQRDYNSVESTEMAIIDAIMYINMRYNKTYSIDVNIVRDEIAIKNFFSSINRKGLDKVGMKALSGRGEMMEIVEYFAENDITVRFADGTIVKHKSMGNFKSGNICNPNYFRNTRIGLTNCSNSGMMMRIIDYIDAKTVVIQFEDGAIVTRSWQAFDKGKVAHPKAA